MLLKMQVHMSTAHAEITGSTRIVCEQVRLMISVLLVAVVYSTAYLSASIHEMYYFHSVARPLPTKSA